MFSKEMFSKLEWDSAEKLKIPENHYTDTYHLFHRRVGDFAKLKNSADVAGSAEVSASSPTFEGIGSLISGHLLNYFSPTEQFPLPDHEQVRSLDTASFKDMTEIIIQNCKPSHSETFTKKTKATNLKSLKKFVKDAAESIAENFGVTPPTIYFNLLKSIISILDDAELIDSEEETKMEKENNSIEVHKNGLVVIAYYRYEFHGKITQNCCSVTHDANVAIEVKAWKFTTTADLEKEYDKIIHQNR
jgi:DNA-binding transcriptional ArsR family regulator